MSSKPTIKIFVSGHKACVLPESGIYIPVQVGAARTATRLKGMTPDDQGDNISSLNSSFSELTAQYWAWRNTESDYVGACHYRRYFCFDGLDHPDAKNDHMQIEVDRLCRASIDEYNIDNEELIQRVVTSYDAVVPEEWDVGATMTPRGVKTNIRDHMEGYGLIKDAAYELLEQIVNEQHPEYAPDLHDYLYGKMYLGYSCFVMRRELFDRLCTFEFDVLMEFTSRYDDKNRTSTQMRLGGYLGEILFSTFILHIKREGASIAHFPLTFFFETDPLLDAHANSDEKAPVHHIIWDTDGQSAAITGVCANTIIASLEGVERWDITIAVSSQNEVPTIKQAARNLPANVKLQFVTKPVFDTRMLGASGKYVMSRNLEAGSMCLAPWLFEQWEDVLFLRGAVLFNAPFRWEGFASAAMKSNLPVLAAQDVYASAELNCGANPTAEELARKLGLAVRDLRDYSICYMNLSMLRASFNQEDVAHKMLAVIKTAEGFSGKQNYLYQSLLTNAALAMFESGELSIEHFYPINHAAKVSTWCYADVSTAWANANAASSTVFFYTKDASPFDDDLVADNAVFWQVARTSPLYEQLFAELVQGRKHAEGHKHSGWKDALFPDGTRRRSFARRSLSAIRKLRR